MIFFNPEPVDLRDISPEQMEVYEKIKKKSEKDKEPIDNFTEKTILYVQKTEAEFGKDVKVESGIMPAAKEVFGKKDEIHEKIDDMLKLTFKYETEVIDCWENNNLGCLIKSYDGYSRDFLEYFNKIDNISRQKGKDLIIKSKIDKVLNAVKQVKIDFLEYQKSIQHDFWNIKRTFRGENTQSYIA